MTDDRWSIHLGHGPIVATAIHDGHVLRDEVAGLTALDDAARLREEDPYTAAWTDIASTRIVAHRSRFEVDLNRPRDRAVYVVPEHAWGLDLWRAPPSAELVARSLEQYDAFYVALHRVLTDLTQRHPAVVVLDLHSYNHRRDGPGGAAAPVALNPEVNIGTGTLDRGRWGPLIDGFIADLSGHDFLGRSLDVRENVKFQGGQMSRWIHQTFPLQVCSIAVEFKKFFMDEWSGAVDPEVYQAIAPALQGTLPRLQDALTRFVPVRS